MDCAVAAGQTNRRKDRQPDTDRYIDPAPHNMRAVSIKLKSIKLCFFYSRGAGAIYVGGVRAPRLRVDGQGAQRW